MVFKKKPKPVEQDTTETVDVTNTPHEEPQQRQLTETQRAAMLARYEYARDNYLDIIVPANYQTSQVEADKISLLLGIISELREVRISLDKLDKTIKEVSQ